MSRSERFRFAASIARYLPGLLAILLTMGVSLATHLSVAVPGLLTTGLLAVPPAVVLASAIVWSDRDPSGLSLLVVAGLSWALFSVARLALVDPAAGRLVGSPYALLDLGLVWLGSYAVVGGIVYGTEWPTFDTDAERDTERERSQPDVADD
jgi:hypothetical protein